MAALLFIFFSSHITCSHLLFVLTRRRGANTENTHLDTQISNGTAYTRRLYTRANPNTHTHTHRHTYRIIYDCAPFINYGYTKVRFTNQCDYNIQPYNGTGMFCTSTQYTRGTLAHAHAYTQSYTRPCACMWHAQSRTSTNLCRVATRRTRTLTSGHASEVQSTCHTGPPITPRADGYKASRPKCRAPCPPRPPHSSRNGLGPPPSPPPQ